RAHNHAGPFFLHLDGLKPHVECAGVEEAIHHAAEHLGGAIVEIRLQPVNLIRLETAGHDYAAPRTARRTLGREARSREPQPYPSFSPLRAGNGEKPCAHSA